MIILLLSRALLENFNASKYFNVVTDFPSEKLANSAMLNGDVDVILEIPNHFERDLVKDEKARFGSNHKCY